MPRMTLRGALTSARAMPRDVLVLTLNAFFVSLGFGVMMPVLPTFARQFGVSTTMISLVISAFAFMRLITSPLAGPLIDRFGAKLNLGVGIFAVAASSAAAGLATSFLQLLIFRGIGGIGSAIFTVAAMTMLVRSVPSTIRGRATGLYQSGFLIGAMAGPAVGGLVSTISPSAPFFFYAITLTVGGVLVLTLIRPRPVRVEATTDAPPPLPLRQVLRDVRYRVACLANFATGWQAFGVRSALVPLLITGAMGLGTQWSGYVFAIAAVAQTIALAPVGRATDTRGRRPMILAGALIVAVTSLAIPFSPNVAVLAAVLAVLAVGSAMLSTAPTATAGDVVGRHGGGTPLALFSMTSDIGVIVGPLVAGMLTDSVGMGWAFAAGSVLLLLVAAAATRMPGGVPDAQPDDRPDDGRPQGPDDAGVAEPLPVVVADETRDDRP